jgi:hypothetical protein
MPETASSTPLRTPETPTFTGPFAAEYQEAWTKNEAPAVREVLRDERISDQEWSQVLVTLTDCLTGHGISLVTYNEDGSYEANTGTMDGEAANQAMGACETESAEVWIGRLYRAQTNNPNNVPETQLLTDCMIRNKAVPETYTVDQYLEDAPDMSFPYTDHHGPDIFSGCNADPDFVH